MPESLMGTHCTTSVIIQVKAEPYLNNFAGRCQCYNWLGNGLMASDLVTTVIMTTPRAHTVTLCPHETVLASVSSELCQVSPLRARHFLLSCDTAWHLGPGPRLCNDHITPSQVTRFARCGKSNGNVKRAFVSWTDLAWESKKQSKTIWNVLIRQYLVIFSYNFPFLSCNFCESDFT